MRTLLSPEKKPLFLFRQSSWMLLLATFSMVSLFAPELQAADPVKVSGANDFAEIYGRLVGWIKGDLGRTLSISFVLIGLAYGMARNSLIGFATGVGAAVGLQVTPTIINSIFGL
ncbi:TraA family conjugative transfer protein [Endozoicomonas arenosclerae]|uniref:TraA family conjugative transfer protein n=1 Tax=Endozoicomonas arenosclerae TaxID=1633495 RepID=UPI000A3ED0DE|nr:TraA family conjugative transfer protein [Endozoicomonas arenosclerae]